MEELVKYIVDQLVENKEAVSVASSKAEDGYTTIHVAVAKEDMGRVIGKNGKIAQALRAIVKTASAKSTEKYLVKIDEKAE